MSGPIVITGEPSSGKTLLASALAHEFGYRPINVGDLLAERLDRVLRLVPRNRDSIGMLFFRHFKIADYVDCIDRVTDPDVVLDGVRMLVGVRVLRDRFPRLLHVHRVRQIGPPRMREPFSEDTPYLEEAADIVERRTDRARGATPEALTLDLLCELRRHVVRSTATGSQFVR